ncbi:MAG: hypothetical protein KBF66_13525 [Rhodoferax sp.]|uniref:hypothetical protein n=1 Tax=Rhodoferax sp. TaxID=50421 RepID=UPI001B58D286|nr:hypothetical protein [Rhodoferax sp.]MBP9906576.1 hypothetical protein [Rhodoferax sp.]
MRFARGSLAAADLWSRRTGYKPVNQIPGIAVFVRGALHQALAREKQQTPTDLFGVAAAQNANLVVSQPLALLVFEHVITSMRCRLALHHPGRAWVEPFFLSGRLAASGQLGHDQVTEHSNPRPGGFTDGYAGIVHPFGFLGCKVRSSQPFAGFQVLVFKSILFWTQMLDAPINYLGFAVNAAFMDEHQVPAGNFTQ